MVCASVFIGVFQKIKNIKCSWVGEVRGFDFECCLPCLIDRFSPLNYLCVFSFLFCFVLFWFIEVKLTVHNTTSGFQ